MRVFVAGASGVLGRRLVPQLVAAGHHVIATTRTPQKVQAVRDMGADPVVADGLSRDAMMKAVVSSRPDVVVHQMTALASMRNLRNFDEQFAATNRLRMEGTRSLLAAARVAGARRFVAQSFTGWPNAREGGRVKTEDDPLDATPPRAMSRTLDAIRTLERMVTTAEGITGIVLRYGYFYGPGTSFSSHGEIVELVRRRELPLVGGGSGIWSFIHIDDAAVATRLAIERGTHGLFNIVDDDPAEVSTWLPELAKAVGAKPPYRVPSWVGRLAIGEAGLSIMTMTRGSSNARAKRVLDWQPAFASWREGFRALSC